MKNKVLKILLLLLVLSLVFGVLTSTAAVSADIGMTFDDLVEYETAEVRVALPLTYEATVRFDRDQGGKGGVILGCYTDDKTSCFNFEIGEGGSPRIRIIDGSAVKYDVAFNNVSVYNGDKTHIAITLDKVSGNAFCYLNGTLAETVKATIPAQFDITSVFALGGDNLVTNADYFKGELFGVALYNDVRTSSEIATDASGGSTATDGLIAAYSPLSYENEKADVMVTGDASYKMTYTCEWIKDLPAPESYSHSFAVIGDIQSMTYYYPELLIKQFEWIRDNKDARKIAFSVGLGDITEKNTAAEYLKVIEAYDKIDGLVPFSIIRGNHERTSDNSTAMYDAYISQDRYGDEITGSYDGTMQNTYRIIKIGKVKYMFMNLDLSLTDGAMEWANRIIGDNPDCHVIVSTHVYKNMSGSYLVLDGKFGAENNPEDLWDRVLSQHENVVMVLFGHSPKNTLLTKQREGVHGNVVTEMLINPSETDKVYGGGGFVAMFYFSEDGEQLDVQYYSTIKDAYFKSENQFHLELDTPGAVEFSSVIMNVGSDESERNLTWYAQYDLPGEVRYGKSEDGTLPESYLTSAAVASKAVKDGSYTYKATMKNLEANSTYVYQLVVGGVVSECYTFNTYGMDDDFKFAFVTDPQVKESSHSALWDDTLDKILNKFGEVSLVVSAGDQTSEPSSEDNFDWFISKHLSSLAIATTNGPPHDNSKLYKDHYNLPNLSTNYGVSTPTSDYFYTYNNVLFMHLNVEDSNYDEHISFMENTVADNPDCTWRVVLLHFSFFSGGNHSTDGSVKGFRTALAGKFTELGVDVVLSGHDHVYTRSNMMKNGYTLSGDTVTGGAVTDPTGTLYICGTSSTGSGWYSVEHHDDDAYIAKSEDANRKSVVIFSVTEGSLTLKTYFIDGATPEQYDSFTINKTRDTVRLDKDTDMLEFLQGTSRIPLVNAYSYDSATVKTVGGYWSLSTDGGSSFESLGISSADTIHVLRINPDTGIWELSSDGGESFVSLGISSRTYTVKYVTLPGAGFGDATDLTAFAPRRFTSLSPDAPEPWMPRGELRLGNLYTWDWEYYLEGGDGTPVTAFEYGKSYIAYPLSTPIPIASTIYIDTVSNPSEYTYTWREAWEIVSSCPREKMTLLLKNDITLTADDAVILSIPVNLTLDLGGKRLDTSAITSAVKFGVGSNGSSFTLVTSADGGTLNAGLNNLLELGSNQGSTISVQYGSEETRPLTVESISYLVFANGNFKYTSTLNLAIFEGSYTVARGVVYVSNVSTSASKNIYKINLKDAAFRFSGADSAIVRSKGPAYFANAASYLLAEGCSFTDTNKADHSSSRFIIREDIWYGSMSFTDCDFVGMSVGRDCQGTAYSSPSSITVGKGCTFVNSATSFNTGNPLSFISPKVSLADGCVLVRTDEQGSAEVMSLADAVEITWYNPIGYKEYWKSGVTPVYLGDTSFTVGDVSYSLVLTETPSAATENKAYAFRSDEGYLYRYDDENGVWQISTDGGDTYTNIGEAEADPEEPIVGCTVTVDAVSTSYPPDTDFRDVLQTVNTTAHVGKVIKITLDADMSFKTGITYNRASTLEIDLGGHKLTYEADDRFKVGASKLHVYSSLPGGEFIFGGTKGSGLQPSGGAVVFGSEEYKNYLTVSTANEILNPAQTADGKTLHFEFLYCTVNTGANNLLRINAKGAGAITLEMKIVGCTVTGDKSVLCYNYSTSLSATANGGVCNANSYIDIADTTFVCTATDPLGFFGGPNFTDRYFGTVSIVGSTFQNYTLNGDLIISDEALSYNTYFDTLGTDYDPLKAITVGENCTFINYGDTFTDDKSGFRASNVSLGEDCKLSVLADSVKTVSGSYGCSVEIDGNTVYYPKSTDFKDVLAALEIDANTGKVINVALNADMTAGSTITFTSIKNYALNIDLSGHKLTVNAGGRLSFGGSGFSLKIYSSKPGAELVFSSTDDAIQMNNGGLVVFGSEEYKNNLTVTSPKEVLNVAQISNGSVITVKYLYSTFNIGSFGLLRLNAKGAGVVTLDVEITGCTVNGAARVICYNSSSNLKADANGGVYSIDSGIAVKDTRFNCLYDTPLGIFGHDNFTDRYFGTASFVGCTFNNYFINGDLIRSDESLSYNTYYDSIADGYDPRGAIKVGEGCVFTSYGDGFKGDLSDFSASNVSVAEGCFIAYTDNSVLILDSSLHALSDWKSEDGKHWRECESCSDGVKLNLAECKMDTSVTPAVCTLCGAVAEEPDDPTHTHSYTDVITPPTCTERGYTTHTCAECGDVYVDSYVPATGHSYGDWTVTVTPDCTSDGTRTKECSVCHITLSETLDAYGHDEIEHGAKAPTCTEVGWYEYVSCSKCDYLTYEEIPEKGHTLTDATCESAATCTVCGATEGTALGHSFADATCESPKTCTVCGTTDGTALGHSFTDATTEAPKTCTRCGKTEGDKLPDEEVIEPPCELPEDEHYDCTADFFTVLWNAIVNFFRRMFGMPELCVCGKEL
ncbi:MAG: metallophosphoesterase [Clostridia bacterium]|nr:metallophosphoesterase [Clostridia bacterium]